MPTFTALEVNFLLESARRNRENSAALAEIPTQRWREAHKTEVARMDILIEKLEALAFQVAKRQNAVKD